MYVDHNVDYLRIPYCIMYYQWYYLVLSKAIEKELQEFSQLGNFLLLHIVLW